MGDAKNIVKGTGAKAKAIVDGTSMGLLPMCDKLIEDLETATMIKLEDSKREGDEERARNHYKLALLYCAMSLTRRVREALKDYDTPLDDAAYDENS